MTSLGRITVDSLDGFPSDVIISILVARLGGKATINMSNDVFGLEGIETKDLVILLDFEENEMTLSLREHEGESGEHADV